MPEVEFNKKLEEGYIDIKFNITINAKKAFEDIRKDYNL